MATRKKSPFAYSDAANELETILDEIEGGDTDIETLSERVERAAELIRGCRDALEGTELRVRKVVEDLAGDEDDDAGEASA